MYRRVDCDALPRGYGGVSHRSIDWRYYFGDAVGQGVCVRRVGVVCVGRILNEV